MWKFRKPPVSAYDPYQCSLCKNLLVNAHATPCRHIFCHECITKAVQEIRSCPICKKVMNKSTPLTPRPDAQQKADAAKIEYEIEKFIKSRGYEEISHNVDHVLEDLMRNRGSLDRKECRAVLLKRQRKLLQEWEEKKNLMVAQFLHFMQVRKKEEAYKLLEESNIAGFDLQCYLTKLKMEKGCQIDEKPEWAEIPQQRESLEDIFNRHNPLIVKHYDSLEEEYKRVKQDIKPPNAFYGPGIDNPEFSNFIQGMCKYTDMTPIASMDYSRDGQSNPQSTPTVVSAIEFDKDGEYFVIAGIAQKMKIYGFDMVMEKPQSATPLGILPTTVKVSNVSWNPFVKPILASSYYSGNIQVWDAHKTLPLHTYTEHEKRCWSIQFNNIDMNIMASGGDDGKVKIWSLLQGNSVSTIDTKILVCCVHFNPTCQSQFAFGGSDRCIYLYDLRNLIQPLKVLKGHKKPVSYVKYIDSTHLVSASTDSTLRIWNIHEDVAERVLEGHLNEKNFVGLATNGEHIICGSESNEVYTYYKKCHKPMCKFDFAMDLGEDLTGLGLPRISTNDLAPDFVSALCWKKESNIVMAANSQGRAQILQLNP